MSLREREEISSFTLVDTLSRFELEVARRADRLVVPGSISTPGEDVSRWLQAEREVLGDAAPWEWGTGAEH